jgi:hypothetical protein
MMLHSIIDYVSADVFIGLITDERLMILTHDCQLYHLDKVFGEEGFEHRQFQMVGFQDSLMLFSTDRTIIHWEIIALNKCRKTVYSISESLDCLSDLNQVFNTLNRIPFLINNDMPLKIKKLSSYFITPMKVDISEWVHNETSHQRHKSCTR